MDKLRIQRLVRREDGSERATVRRKAWSLERKAKLQFVAEVLYIAHLSQKSTHLKSQILLNCSRVFDVRVAIMRKGQMGSR
jgi:hypothetical protein